MSVRDILQAASGLDSVVSSRLYFWGSNVWGSIGNNTAINRAEPTLVNNENWSQVSVGQPASAANFCVAVRTNGTLWTWGGAVSGQLGNNSATGGRSSPVQVGALSNWSLVAGGTSYCLAVKTDGTLWAWGSNTSGTLGNNTVIARSSPVQIGLLTNWSKVIASGAGASFAVKTDGTLWSWGLATSGVLGLNDVASRSSPTQIGALSDWAQVAAGANFCTAIKTDGTLWSWGSGGNGRTGLNDVANRSSPTQIGALSGWAQVAAGNSHCIAVKTDGTLWAWGSSTGLGNSGSVPVSSPIQIGALSDWAQVAAGNGYSLAIKTNNTLWSWGEGSRAALGNNKFVTINSPVQVGTGTWSKLSACKDGGTLQEFSAAISAANKLHTWGLNTSGQLGQLSGNVSSPVQIGSSEWASCSTGADFCMAIKSTGTLWAWGRNNSGGSGQLGNNNVVDVYSTPNQIGSLSTWASVSCGDSHVLAVKTDGTLWAWGFGESGNLGNGTIFSNTSSPIQIGALSDWAQVAASGSAGSFILNSAAIKTNGTLWTWGSGSSGALGSNATTNRSSPVQVGALSNWAQVSIGPSYCLAVKTDGTLWAWGSGSDGRLGTGNLLNVSSPVQIGALTNWAKVSASNSTTPHCLAVKTDGTLWAWGRNLEGQLGNGTKINASSPIQIGLLTDWDSVSSGNLVSIAYKTTGTLWSWGNNGAGVLGINQAATASRSSPVQIGALTNWVNLVIPQQTTAGALSS